MSAKTSDQPAHILSHTNCFDLLRLLLAISVVYTHSYLLGGFGDEHFWTWNKEQTYAGNIGVLGFFGLSGYLVTASFLKRDSPGIFLLHRIKRIFPAFIICLLATAFVFAPLIHGFRFGDLTEFAWSGDEGAFRYVWENILLRIHQWNIGNTLDGLPYSGSINGPLWSLFPEFCCYLGVLVLGLSGALSKNRTLVFMSGFFLFALHSIRTANPEISYPALPTFLVLSKYLPYLLAFLTGSLCHLFHGHTRLDFRQTLLLGGILALLLKLGGWDLLAPVLFPVFLINLGELFTLRLKHDFSYGIYIYGFPCQQLLATSEFARSHFLIYLVSSVMLATLCGAASWFLIEKHFLLKKKTPVPKPV
jgi:peptidoglycan/LPS O-acetylase OafA/YrhL